MVMLALICSAHTSYQKSCKTLGFISRMCGQFLSSSNIALPWFFQGYQGRFLTSRVVKNYSLHFSPKIFSFAFVAKLFERPCPDPSFFAWTFSSHQTTRYWPSLTPTSSIFRKSPPYHLPKSLLSSTTTMSSPAKATDGKIADLSPSELRLMVFSNLCYGEVKVHCLLYA